jgi:hypothetical protein
MTISGTLLVQCIREHTQATGLIMERLKWLTYGYYWEFKYNPKSQHYQYMYQSSYPLWGVDPPECTRFLIRGKSDHNNIVVSSKFEARTNEDMITRIPNSNTWHLISKYTHLLTNPNPYVF